MVHPAAIPGASVAGAEMIRELPAREAAALYPLFWAALTWSHAPDAGVPDLGSAEAQALARLGEERCWAAVAVIAGQLAGEGLADPTEMGQACFCLADWALARGACGTATAFTLLAPLVLPRNPRFAWAAGRFLRQRGCIVEAEAWFRRAHRVAVWRKDPEVQIRALNSLGNIHLTVGRKGFGQRLQLKALTLSRRYALRMLEGEVSHDLFVAHASCGELELAEAAAAVAFDAYRRGHPKLPLLVHDIAQLWLEQGFHWRSLPIFQALMERRDLPHHGVREFAGAARAAGAAAERGLFEHYVARVWECVPVVPAAVGASALYEVGLGAELLEDFRYAEGALQRALELAHTGGAADVEFQCENALRRIAGASAACVEKRRRRELHRTVPGDDLAMEMARTIGSVVLDSA
jgi:hypothetical protein